MRNDNSNANRTTASLTRQIALFILSCGLLVTGSCSDTPNQPAPPDVVVTAPAEGVVRSVLVNEGAIVEKDTAIIEIAVEQPASSQPADSKSERERAVRVAQANVAAAEAEANRTGDELRRIEPLVRRGLASQAELEKARAAVQDSQQRVQTARNKAKSAEDTLNQPPAVPTQQTIVAVRVPAAGTVRTVSVQPGQAVKTGQPLATLGARA